jgi:hypothetical protein
MTDDDQPICVRNEPRTRVLRGLVGVDRPLTMSEAVSWCGHDNIACEFFYLSIDHAANAARGDVCDDCLKAIIAALNGEAL